METNEVNLVQAPPVNKLLDFIDLEYHSYFREALPLISTLLHSGIKLDEGNEKKIELIYTHFEKLRDLIEQHVGKEKYILFPIIQELLENTTESLEIKEFERFYTKILNENIKLVSILTEIKKLTNNFKTSESASHTLKQCYVDLFLLEHNLNRYVEIEKDILLPKLIGIEEGLKQGIPELFF